MNGVFVQFPGIATDTLSFDPRLRPWYVTAVSGDKTIILLVDISNAMKKANFQIVKKAVLSVLDGLQANSLISIIAFNNDISLSCFGVVHFVYILQYISNMH